MNFALPAQESLWPTRRGDGNAGLCGKPLGKFLPGLRHDHRSITPPQGLRVDDWVETGTEISPYYDPMLAKFIATGATAQAAIADLRDGAGGRAR